MQKVLKSIERKNMEQWEMVRQTAYHISLVHMDEKTVKKFPPQKFFPLPWDINNELLKKEIERKKYTQKERNEMASRMLNK